MQEMTMVERVARAIYDAGRSYGSKPWSRAEKDDRDDSLYLARAAIEAMREPSLMMQSSALPYVNRQHQTRSVWRAMIDAALSE